MSEAEGEGVVGGESHDGAGQQVTEKARFSGVKVAVQKGTRRTCV